MFTFIESHFIKNNFFRWFYWFFLRRMQLKYHIQISDRTTIGHGLYLGHMGYVVISHNAVIAIIVILIMVLL